MTDQHDVHDVREPMQFFPEPDPGPTAVPNAPAGQVPGSAGISLEDAELIKGGLIRVLTPVSDPMASAKELIAAFEVINAATACRG